MITSPWFWIVSNVATALLVATVLAYMLARYGDEISRMERIGLGFAGACMLLRIGPIIARNLFSENSPFDDWSVSGLHVALTVYVLGWLWRKEGQEWLAAWRAWRFSGGHR